MPRERHLSERTRAWVRAAAPAFEGAWSYRNGGPDEYPRQRLYDHLLERLCEYCPREALEGDWDGEVDATAEAKAFVWEVVEALPAPPPTGATP